MLFSQSLFYENHLILFYQKLSQVIHNQQTQTDHLTTLSSDQIKHFVRTYAHKPTFIQHTLIQQISNGNNSIAQHNVIKQICSNQSICCNCQLLWLLHQTSQIKLLDILIHLTQLKRPAFNSSIQTINDFLKSSNHALQFANSIIKWFNSIQAIQLSNSIISQFKEFNQLKSFLTYLLSARYKCVVNEFHNQNDSQTQSDSSLLVSSRSHQIQLAEFISQIIQYCIEQSSQDFVWFVVNIFDNKSTSAAQIYEIII